MKPALTLHHGTPSRSRSLVALICDAARYDQAEFDALDTLNRSDYGEEFERASEWLATVRAMRISADLRLRRAELEARGLPWLRVQP